MIRLSLYPGETQDGDTTRGHIYVFVDDKLTAQFVACAGPAGSSRPDRGGHSIGQTPAGHYVLGDGQHHVTGSWPMSAIPWSAQLRRNAAGEVEWSADGLTWRAATGPDGTLTQAGIVFQARSLGRSLSDAEKTQVADQYRGVFPAELPATYHENDFGEWAWNLNQPAGSWTPYFLHTTPDDEAASAAGRPVLLANSHGCVHIRPVDRDTLMKNGWLAHGTPFVVQPYGQVGPVAVG